MLILMREPRKANSDASQLHVKIINAEMNIEYANMRIFRRKMIVHRSIFLYLLVIMNSGSRVV